MIIKPKCGGHEMNWKQKKKEMNEEIYKKTDKKWKVNMKEKVPSMYEMMRKLAKYVNGGNKKTG